MAMEGIKKVGNKILEQKNKILIASAAVLLSTSAMGQSNKNVQIDKQKDKMGLDINNNQTPNPSVGKVSDFGFDLNPDFNIDMSKYPPGTHPAKAFEMQSYENATLQGKIEMTKQAIDATNRNIKIDKSEGENTEELEKELKRLEEQLRKLEQQNQPSV